MQRLLLATTLVLAGCSAPAAPPGATTPNTPIGVSGQPAANPGTPGGTANHPAAPGTVAGQPGSQANTPGNPNAVPAQPGSTTAQGPGAGGGNGLGSSSSSSSLAAAKQQLAAALPASVPASAVSKILTTLNRTTPGATVATVTVDGTGHVTSTPSADVLVVKTSDTTQTTVVPPTGAKAVVFSGAGGVQATFNDAGALHYHLHEVTQANADVIVQAQPGSADAPASGATVLDPANLIQGVVGAGFTDSADGKSFTLTQNGATIGTFLKDPIDSSNADAAKGLIVTPTLPEQERVVIGTTGADQIVIQDAHNTQLVLNGGGDTVNLGSTSSQVEVGSGNNIIVGGTGTSVVQMGGNATDYAVTVDNGHAIVTHATGEATVTDISKVQFVQLDDGKALVFANDTQQAAVTTLYETTFGRTADAGGLKYWFDKAAAGESLQEIASDFTHSSEFASEAALSDADFVNALYQHTFGRDAEADGLAYWTAALETGGATRAQLAASFSDIASHNIDGTIHTEASVVGSVTIVHNIL